LGTKAIAQRAWPVSLGLGISRAPVACAVAKLPFALRLTRIPWSMNKRRMRWYLRELELWLAVMAMNSAGYFVQSLYNLIERTQLSASAFGFRYDGSNTLCLGCVQSAIVQNW
jgi:hypothetical protein